MKFISQGVGVLLLGRNWKLHLICPFSAAVISNFYQISVLNSNNYCLPRTQVHLWAAIWHILEIPDWKALLKKKKLGLARKSSFKLSRINNRETCTWSFWPLRSERFLCLCGSGQSNVQNLFHLSLQWRGIHYLSSWSSGCFMLLVSWTSEIIPGSLKMYICLYGNIDPQGSV